MYNVNSIRKFVLSAQSPKEKGSAIMNFLVVTIKMNIYQFWCILVFLPPEASLFPSRGFSFWPLETTVLRIK